MKQSVRINEVYSQYDRTKWSTGHEANRIQQLERDAAILVSAEKLGINANSVVLDVGCGFGHISEVLASSALEPCVVGVELLWDRCVHASGSGLSVAQIDGDFLPIQTGSVDLVILATVLSSVPSSQLGAVLGEVTRTMKTSGSILVFDMHLPSRNNNVSRMSTGLLKSHLPGMAVSRKVLTLPPPLARRLPRSMLNRYEVISKFIPIRSHSLWVFTQETKVLNDE